MWADRAIEELRKGNNAVIYPKGNSMRGKIESGQKVTLGPPTNLEVDTIVLVKVKGNIYLHLIVAMKENEVLIGNNKGGINGWTSVSNVYGKVLQVG